MSKPFLCRIGLHQRYHYLPRVSGDLGKISIACRHCGYGLRYFTGKWDMSPEDVQEGIAQEAQIEYGHVLGMARGVSDPLQQMQIAYNIIKGKFTVLELLPIEEQIKECKELRDKIKNLTPSGKE